MAGGTGEGKLQHDTFVKLFKESGYLTGYFNSNWRMPPEYGYINGFDRGVYCYGNYRGKCVDLIENMIDHLYAFPNRDHFITLGLFDLHTHFFDELPQEIGLQINETIEELAYCRSGKWKSTDKIFTPTLANIYKKQLRLLDYKLQILYNFIAKKYAPNEYAVLLCADHGESYLSPSDFPAYGPIQITNADTNKHNEVHITFGKNAIIYI